MHAGPGSGEPPATTIGRYHLRFRFDDGGMYRLRISANPALIWPLPIAVITFIVDIKAGRAWRVESWTWTGPKAVAVK